MKIFSKTKNNSLLLVATLLIIGIIVSIGSPKDINNNQNEYFAGWNSNIDIVNILEISNSGTESTTLDLEFYQSSGVVSESQRISLNPSQQKDIILNSFKSFKKDSYGIVKVKTNSQNISGRLSYYRASSQTNSFEFGFSAPLKKSMLGQSNVSFNTFNPSGESNVVANWLSLLNLSDQEQKFMVAKRNMQGILVSAPQEISLQPFARYDYEAGHVLPGKDSVGLISVTPLNPNSAYLANLTRYGLKEDNSGFNFAFQLQANPPQGKLLNLPIKNRIDVNSNKLQNWLEVVNTDQNPQLVKIDFFDEQGLLLKSISQNFAAYSQIHFNASQILDTRNFGSVKILAKNKNILAQSMFYVLKDKSQGVSQVYGSQSKSPNRISATPTLSWNRFIGMENYLTIVNPFVNSQNVKININSSDGKTVTQSLEIPGYGTKVIQLNTAETGTKPDNYGTVILINKLISEVVRVKKSTNNLSVEFTNQTSDTLSDNISPPVNIPNEPIEEEQDPIYEDPNVPTKDIILSDLDQQKLKQAAASVRANGSASPFSLQGISEEGIQGVELVPHEIRSASYNENMKNNYGSYNPEDLVTFFKSTTETKDNYLRLTLIEGPNGARISGILSRNGKRYLLRPHIMDLQGKRLMLTEEDFELNQDNNFSCKEVTESKPKFINLNNRTNNTLSKKDLNIQTNKIYEVATDADHEKFLKYGSISATNAAILAILNEVDAVYKNSINISIKVVNQNVWNIQNDPYTSIIDEERLIQFRNYSRDNFRTKFHYDYINLFTGLTFPKAVGMALGDTACTSRVAGMTIHYSGPTAKMDETFTIVHEMAHTLGVLHDNCPNNELFIMCPEENKGKNLRFSPGSIATFNETLPILTCLNYLGKGNAPKIVTINNQSVTVGKTMTIDIYGSDSDSDGFYAISKTLPTGAKLDDTGSFVWTPQINQIGNHSVELGIQDIVGNTSFTKFTITVNPLVANRAPVLSGVDNKSLTAGSNLNFLVSAIDPDNDPINIAASNLPLGATFSSNRFNWTPSTNQVGTFNVSFRASDPKGASDNKTSRVTVNPQANRAPSINNVPNSSVLPNNQLVLNLNGSDPDGDTVSYSFSPNLNGARITNNQFTWTPTTAQVGTYNVNFTITDSKGASNSVNSQIIVQAPANRAPSINGVPNSSVLPNNQLVINLTGSDPDGDTVSYSFSPNINGARITNNQFTWTPTPAQAGTYNVNFTITDSKGASNSVNSQIIVTSQPNRAPVINVVGNRNITVNSQLNITLSGSDPDGDSLTYSATPMPVGATLINNLFSWTPSVNQTGNFNIRFSVNDGRSGKSNSDSVITVNPLANRAPSLNFIGDRTLFLNSNNTISISGQDPDGDTLTYSATNLPPGATFSNQNFSFNPTSTATYNVTFRVTDSRGASASETVKINCIQASATPWQNPRNRLDVNNDSLVNQLDVDLAIKRTNEFGLGELTGTPNFARGEYYYDVNGDRSLSPTDILIIINFINSQR